jgi:hypothetical protein
MASSDSFHFIKAVTPLIKQPLIFPYDILFITLELPRNIILKNSNTIVTVWVYSRVIGELPDHPCTLTVRGEEKTTTFPTVVSTNFDTNAAKMAELGR